MNPVRHNSLELLDAHPGLAEPAAKLFVLAGQEAPFARFLDGALPCLREAAGAEWAAYVRGEKGQWKVLSHSGAKRPLPTELLGEALDREAPTGQAPWWILPLAGEPGDLLVFYQPWEAGAASAQTLEALARLFVEAASAARANQQRGRRIERLQAILGIAAQWGQTLEMDALLKQMAETSTHLLDAERASIFLWDRRHHVLVGRPALGVNGHELRIPDDRGIVGQVVQSGQPRRLDADEDQREIDRHVDQQLGYHTRTLLCVPLRSRDGEMFGAFEMINKRGGNFTQDDELALIELAEHAAIALENTQQLEQLLRTRRQLADQAAEGRQLIGQCAAMDALRSTVRRVADTDLAVLILGENGTGKEVVAAQVHYLSRRRNEPFVAVNCAALTETLLESELFGHEKGAFTDAHEMRPGKFELASGGTLFLDEIGEMSRSGQAKLLRVLEEKVVVRVGGSTPIHTDARVIAATNQNLAEMVRQKKFREDLYFRLNIVTLELPPLRERGEDILLLAEHFLRDFCAKARRKFPRLTAAARQRLLQHTWPGNVRELRNLMERLAYLTQGEKIDAEELAFSLSPQDDLASAISLELTLAEATRRFQTEYIKKHIDRARGNMTEAAGRLGLHRSNLYRKMRQLGMSVTEEE